MKLNIPFLSAKDREPPKGEPTLELQVLGKPTIQDVTVTPEGVVEVAFREGRPPAIQIASVWCRGRDTPPTLESLKWYAYDKEVSLEELKQLIDGREYKFCRDQMDVIAMLEVDEIQYYAEVQLSYDQNIKE